MGANPLPKISPEEYFERERTAESRSEYYDGYMYAMAGGSWAHAKLIHNLSRRLGNALENRKCSILASDMRVGLSSNTYLYPDVLVVCSDPKFLNFRNDVVLNPLLIVEVLSPTTEAYDRGFKAQQYRSIPSLQEYALVSQAAPVIEVFRRGTNGVWLLKESKGMDVLCDFESVEVAIPHDQIFEGVTLQSEAFPNLT
jgi:Uma2 family endonuclease